ncbi:MAG: hypothetical protein OEV44_04875 [Spirochaetota bacterium]|nr:hypothetical protein [Spirochaetota bacterium]
MKKCSGSIILLVLFTFLFSHNDTEAKSNSTIDKLSNQAVKALQDSKFKDSENLARKVIKLNKNHSIANLIVAITLYKKTMHNFFIDLSSFFITLNRGAINKRYLRWTLEQTDHDLELVEKHLNIASKDPKIFIELNLTRWEIDWNHNGRIDWRDKQFFQIEQDADGKPIPEGDPRRTPTFRFDRGDVYWALAMIDFQRAFINVVVAYSFPDINLEKLVNNLFRGNTKNKKLIISIKDKKKVHKARKLLLTAISHADRARKEYLLEKDDDREWLPNPSQKNHPLPLPVDATLYKTWKDILSDLKALIEGTEGFSIAEIAQLGDHKWKNPPDGFLNVGRLFEEPGDITIDFNNLKGLEKRIKSKANVEKVLRDIFGNKYVKKMKRSLLPSRFSRMKNEIQTGKESFERKLRYLFWLN